MPFNNRTRKAAVRLLRHGLARPTGIAEMANVPVQATIDLLPEWRKHREQAVVDFWKRILERQGRR